MTTDQLIQLFEAVGTWIAVIVAGLATWLAWKIGRKQNILNEQFGKIQDSVELYASPGMNLDKDGNPVGSPFLHIQNVGTRHVYFDRYNFNGRIYELNGHVRPPTYSNAIGNFYWITLPTNEETHASVIIEYHDIDGRKWKSKIIADQQNGVWGVNTFPRESNE